MFYIFVLKRQKYFVLNVYFFALKACIYKILFSFLQRKQTDKFFIVKV